MAINQSIVASPSSQANDSSVSFITKKKTRVGAVKRTSSRLASVTDRQTATEDTRVGLRTRPPETKRLNGFSNDRRKIKHPKPV